MDNSEKSYRILIVDDEPSITQTFELGLRQFGFQVDTYNNPISALASYKPGNYDLLLLDIRMPIMNGFELYKEIRKSDENVKICFITGYEIDNNDFTRSFPTKNALMKTTLSQAIAKQSWCNLSISLLSYFLDALFLGRIQYIAPGG